MRDKIISAIEGRRLITFTYDGIAREAQPCAVGVSRAGNEVLRCYQVRGGHVTPGHEWDLCDLSKIRNLAITEVVFPGDPPGYRRGDRSMTQIFAQL
jgi:adenine deaminase